MRDDNNTDGSAAVKATLTREELHQLVWSTPMNVLAERYAVSEKTLRKICSIHLVPAPPVGYWENVSEGPRRRGRLREVDNAALRTLTIAEKYRSPNSDYLKTVLKEIAAGTDARPDVVIRSKDPTQSEETKAQQPQTVSSPNEMTQRAAATPVTLKDRDPGVSTFMSELQKLRPDGDGFLYLKWIKVPPNNSARVGSLLHRLAGCLRTENLVFDGTAKRVGFSRDGSTVDFEITFPRMQIMVPSTYSDYRRREYRHVGRMQLRIFGWAEGTRKNFTDTDTKAVEDDFDRIVESFRLNIVAEVERDKKRREDEKRRAHFAQRREMASLRAKREEERVKFLREVAEVQSEIGELRTAISTLESSRIESPEIDRMLSWASSRLETLEGRISAESLSTKLIEKKLFHEPDELYDPEGDP